MSILRGAPRPGHASRATSDSQNSQDSQGAIAWRLARRQPPRERPRLVALLAALLAVTLIVSTYHVFDQTYDEAAHIGPGMQWLADHTYTMDLLNAPFARAVIALGPFLLGGRPHHIPDPTLEGNAILASGNYDAMLASARLGTLLFFLFALYLVWSRARRWLGEWGAALTLVLLCTCEPVLGHSGVATTDIALMTMFFWTTDRLWTLATTPSWRNGLWAGLAAGLALACKHSAGPFLVVVVSACIRRSRRAAFARNRGAAVEGGLLRAALSASALRACRCSSCGPSTFFRSAQCFRQAPRTGRRPALSWSGTTFRMAPSSPCWITCPPMATSRGFAMCAPRTTSRALPISWATSMSAARTPSTPSCC